MTAAWMVRQGEGGSNAQELIEAGYMGVDFIGDRDLTPHLGGGLVLQSRLFWAVSAV
ncbi:MAG: hypothetical protein PVSMB10_17420 [Pseudarthrobacter sp.]